MRVSVVQPHELSAEHLTEWRRLQRLDPLLESPFLCPEFTQICAAVRSGVLVAVAEERGQAAAFLPMQRHRGMAGPVAGPVAGGLSDCQAVIAEPGWEGDPRELIRAARVPVYDFTHQRAGQRHFASYHRGVVASQVMDLAGGFDAYAAGRRAAGSGIVTDTAGQARRLARQAGPLRFTMHETDADALRTLITWKRRQYRETGALDIFEHGWTVELLERIHAAQSADFAGVLSALWAGERMVAAHMGMRSHAVLHYWFPAYDKDYAKFSPGLILLLEMARSAAASGLKAIELGPGGEAYKNRLANAAIPVAFGFIGSASLPLWLRRLRHGTEALAERLPIGAAAHWPGRLFRRIERLSFG